MSIEENKALVRRFHNNIMEELDTLLDDNFIGHDIVGHTWDREFQIKGLADDLASFENLTDTIHDIAAEDDKVFIRFTRSGIFTAKYENYEPTNREVHFPVMELLRISNGQIAEIWDCNDDSHVIRILKGEESL